MPAARKARAPHTSSKSARPERPPTAAARPNVVYAAVNLSYQGKTLETGAELQDVLPADVLEAVLERGEATRDKP